ncbi:hypothetical protein BLNAU_7173 [Blattamonas nauphoetae]|uniref:Uncharacterized protein n=1 Tax=Blattamonas nauphoetae TaxID=2049346 RepID=A0ABQ9Y213_9EUKA|nr:hypothetical protein BLNAU_7173 [Blattamonas nauphoetae]
MIASADLSTLNHTTTLITACLNTVRNVATPSENYYTDVVKRITTAVCDESSTFTDKQDYSRTTLLTSGNTDSFPVLVAASLLIVHVTIVTVQHVVHRKIQMNKLQRCFYLHGRKVQNQLHRQDIS